MFAVIYSGGGAITPALPTISWVSYNGSVSTFTMTNVNDLVNYSFTPTTGTVSFTRTTGVITVSTSSEFEVTINSIGVKGNISGPQKIIGRKNITTYTVTSTGGCAAGTTPPEGRTCSEACGGGGSWDGPGCCCAYEIIYRTYENSPPANYQKIGNVWVRI